jgi:hypothetical protein
LSEGFFAKLVAACGRLGCSPTDLTSVWLYESVVRSDAWNHNPRDPEHSSNASGLCQLMPMNFAGVGWTAVGADGKPDHAGFRALTAEQQLPYVERYYKPHTGKLTDNVQCYVATFLPALLDTDPSMGTVLCRKDDPNVKLRLAQAYRGNVGFDVEKKGYITRGDLARAIDTAKAAHKARWAEIVERIGKASS